MSIVSLEVKLGLNAVMLSFSQLNSADGCVSASLTGVLLNMASIHMH